MQNRDIHTLIERLATEIAESGTTNLAIIGIRTGGEALAQALVEILKTKTDQSIDYGVLDITLYRDDLDLQEGLQQPRIRATEVAFPIEGKRVILVDDVLFTGRTVRAALDALADIGRPAKVDLVVLIDRGHRELPIRPDFVGTTLDTSRSDRVHVTYDSNTKDWSVDIRHEQ